MLDTIKTKECPTCGNDVPRTMLRNTWVYKCRKCEKNDKKRIHNRKKVLQRFTGTPV